MDNVQNDIKLMSRRCYEYNLLWVINVNGGMTEGVLKKMIVKRFNDINRVIGKSLIVDELIPVEWIFEYNGLTKQLNNGKEERKI